MPLIDKNSPRIAYLVSLLVGAMVGLMIGAAYSTGELSMWRMVAWLSLGSLVGGIPPILASPDAAPMRKHALAALIAGPCIGGGLGMFGGGHPFLLACMFLGSLLGISFCVVILWHWALACVWRAFVRRSGAEDG